MSIITNEPRGGYWGYNDEPFKSYRGFRSPKLGKTFHVGRTYKFKVGLTNNYLKAKLTEVYSQPVGFGNRGKNTPVRLTTTWVYMDGWLKGRTEQVQDMNLDFHLQ